MHKDAPLANFSGTARLFPLPNLVLFPTAMLPLHVFEPRYRQLTADALRDDRLITMALLRPGWEPDYHQSPPIYPVVCVGQVQKEEHLPDGRYNLLLHGLSRARVLEETQTGKLYRTARVELLPDEPVASPDREADLRRRLGRELTRWFKRHGLPLANLRNLLKVPLALGILCDVLGFALGLSVELKQQLLEAVRVEARVGRLLAHLESETPPDPGPGRKFPPDFSRN